MEPASMCRTGRFYSYERLLVIAFGLLAIVSPLYVDRRPVDIWELDEQPIDLASWLPLLLLLLILAVALSLYLQRSFARFDPNWIHRVASSSGGIIVVLVILALVIKLKSSMK